MSWDLNCCKILYMVYPPYTGGNHFANLLSTHESFADRFKSEDYISHLIENYKHKLNLEFKDAHHTKQFSYYVIDRRNYNAHMYKTTNQIEVALRNLFVHKPFNKTRIIYGHEINYVNTLLDPELKDNLFKYLPQSKAIIFSRPSTEGRMTHRMKFFGSPYYYAEDLYKLPFTISKTPIFDDSNAMIFDSDKFGSNEGAHYLQNFVKENFNIELPDVIYELHDYWVQMIDKSFLIPKSK